MNLNTFIASYVDKTSQQVWDYTGSIGWVHRANLLLRNWVNRGYLTVSAVKEVGVEVNNGFWISIPSDCGEIQKISFPVSGDGTDDPELADKTYKWEIVNGKIKLNDWFWKNSNPTSYALSGWTANSVNIAVAIGAANAFNNQLLVVTNGDLSGQQMQIETSGAVVTGGRVTLNFVLPQGVPASTSTAGYLTDQYLMLKYVADFAAMVDNNSVIPFENKFYPAFAAGLRLMAVSRADKTYATFEKEYQNELDDLESNLFTPSEDDARPKPRSMPGYQEFGDDENDTDVEYQDHFDFPPGPYDVNP